MVPKSPHQMEKTSPWDNSATFSDSQTKANHAKSNGAVTEKHNTSPAKLSQHDTGIRFNGSSDRRKWCWRLKFTFFSSTNKRNTGKFKYDFHDWNGILELALIFQSGLWKISWFFDPQFLYIVVDLTYDVNQKFKNLIKNFNDSKIYRFFFVDLDLER